MTEKAVRQLRTNFEKLGARLGENLAEHSRDLGLVDAFASGSGGGSGKYLESGAAVTPAGIEETKRMLSSKRDFERTEGLKRVIAMMTKNLPVTSFFPLVTSLLSPSTSLQARSLISLYIVHCASNAPELALLSINAYQKDLSDPNPLVRAGAITTLSSMQLSDIRELVGMAIQKGARDSSWYVRRATADAVRALYRADPTRDNLAVLRPTLKVLLDGATPLTVGAAFSAWEELCPTEWDLIHQNYRRVCKMLMDVDEWGQTTLLRVLARYGRSFFLDPTTTSGHVDPDVELALKHSEALLQHLNPAVVLGVIKLHYYLGPPTQQHEVVRPLMRLLQGEPEIAAIALENCALLAEQRPDLFAEHLSTFFVRFSEPVEGRQARVRILVALANESNIRTVLSELLVYVEDVDDGFAASAIQAIGTCAQRVPQVAPECLQQLTKLLQSKHDPTVATTVLVLQTLVRSPSFPATASRAAVITRLASYLYTGKVTDPVARSTIYWLVGQFAREGLLEGCGPDVVRLGAKQFAEESVPAKLQLLTLSAKLLVLAHCSSSLTHLRPLALLFDYLTLLARYDLAYEVRDRARFLAGLIQSGGIGKLKREDGGAAEARGQDGSRMMLEEENFRKGVMPAMATYFETVNKSFVDVPVQDNGVDTLQFLEATEGLIKMFDLLGNPSFAVVQNDMKGNVTKIRTRYEAAPAQSATLEQLVENEKGEKKRTATEGLLWLLRGLKFTQVALARSQADKTEELSVSFSKSYEETLKKYHSFVVKPIFALAMKACPYRKDFYGKLGPPTAPVDEELSKWNSALGEIIARLEAFYEKGNHAKGF